MRLPWRSERRFRSTPTHQCWKKLAPAPRTISRGGGLATANGRLTILLWLWKHVPFPAWLRRAYVELTHPRVLVGVVAFIQDDRDCVLLFHHTYRRRHAWSLPGGYLERNESPFEGIEREVREESGLTLRARRTLAAAFHSPGQLDLLIECEIVSGSPSESPEVNGWQYVHHRELGDILPNHRLLLQQAKLIDEHA